MTAAFRVIYTTDSTTLINHPMVLNVETALEAINKVLADDNVDINELIGINVLKYEIE